VFDRLFETSIINGFLIYKSIHPDDMNKRKGIIRVNSGKVYHFRIFE